MPNRGSQKRNVTIRFKAGQSKSTASLPAEWGSNLLREVHASGAILGCWRGVRDGGRGIAMAVVKQIVANGFAAGLRRIEARVFERNVASARVLEKAGFRLEGRLEKSYVERDGTPYDEFVSARLKIHDA